MKKAIVAIFAVILICLGLTACRCEHQYEEAITTEATCSAEGVKTFTCANCSDSYTEAIPKTTNHQYNKRVTAAATCGKEGTIEEKCSLCNHTIYEKIPKTEKHTTGWGQCTVCGKVCTELQSTALTIKKEFDNGYGKIKECAFYIEKALNSSRYSGTDSAVKAHSEASNHFANAAAACGNIPEFAAIKKDLLACSELLYAYVPREVTIYGNFQDRKTIEGLVDSIDLILGNIKQVTKIIESWPA